VDSKISRDSTAGSCGTQEPFLAKTCPGSEKNLTEKMVHFKGFIMTKQDVLCNFPMIAQNLMIPKSDTVMEK